MAITVKPRAIWHMAADVSFNFTPAVDQLPAEIPQILSSLAGQYFWLPVYETLLTSDIIDDALNSTELMLHFELAKLSSDLADCNSFITDHKHYITPRGVKFLHALIEHINVKNLGYAPKGWHAQTQFNPMTKK